MLTKEERHILEHSTGWKSATPLYRNHFVAGEGHADWRTLQDLCGRGLMRVSGDPGELSGGDTVFSVTKAGIAELKKPNLEATSSRVACQCGSNCHNACTCPHCCDCGAPMSVIVTTKRKSKPTTSGKRKR